MLAGPVVSYTAVMVGANPSFVVGNPTCRTGGGYGFNVSHTHSIQQSLGNVLV